MNRIVREHYPASKLPEELRQGIDPDRNVTVTVVEEEERPEPPMTLEEILKEAAEWRRRNPRETLNAIIERHNLPKRSIDQIDRELDEGRREAGERAE
jgi:hypothetical protein